MVWSCIFLIFSDIEHLYMCLLAMSVLFENIYLSPLPTFFFRCKAFWSSSQRDRRGGRGGLPGTHGPLLSTAPPLSASRRAARRYHRCLALTRDCHPQSIVCMGLTRRYTVRGFGQMRNDTFGVTGAAGFGPSEGRAVVSHCFSLQFPDVVCSFPVCVSPL